MADTDPDPHPCAPGGAAQGPGPAAPPPALRALRVLHLEDSVPDHELALLHLQRAGLRLEMRRVDTERAYCEALAQGGWDLILSDFNLPGFNGLRAQQLLRDSGQDLPFILVSGEIGEDTAVSAMRNGAADYLLKHNLARLAPAVEHAIEAHQDRQARRLADSELAASRQRLSELAQHLQTSVERERAAIAREIHDDVGGSLTAIKFDLAWIGRHAALPEVKARVQSALETVDHAIEASQRIMHNLRPAILEQGLVAALQWMASRFEKREGLPCQFRTNQEAMQLPSGVPLVAYRFVQEALTNISKHAQAGKVTIDLSLSRGVLSVEVSDDGCGLDRQDLAKARSFGLRGLHERASTVGGWVEVSSQRGSTVLLLAVPVRQAGPAAPADFDRDDDHDPSAWGNL